MVLVASVLAVLFGLSIQAATATAASPATHAVQDPAPNGDSGTTIDPLQYNCGNNAPTCGQVGESNGYYNGTNVDLLYTENYYCDANVTSAAATGCEAGQGYSGQPSGGSPGTAAGPAGTPSATSSGSSGTSLGNTTHGDTLYISVPLFANPPATQCTATATCIDHPPTIDLSRLAAFLPGSQFAGNSLIEGKPVGTLDATTGPLSNLKPWLLKEIAGFRLLLIGLTTPALTSWLPPENLVGLEALDPLESLRHREAGRRIQVLRRPHWLDWRNAAGGHGRRRAVYLRAARQPAQALGHGSGSHPP